MPPKLKTTRTRAAMRAGKADWYRITNHADTGTATIYLYDEIGQYWGVSASDFVEELSELQNVTAIDLHINSPGGEIFEGIAIMNCLMAHSATITVYVDGFAASIASVIAMAGDRIVMGPHSQLMIHDGSGFCIGNAADMTRMAEMLDFQSDNIAGVYLAKAGGTLEGWRALMEAETWYTAEEAVAAGLADEVSKRPGAPAPAEGDPPMDRTWDLSVFQYAGRQAAPAPTAVAVTAVEVPAVVADEPAAVAPEPAVAAEPAAVDPPAVVPVPVTAPEPDTPTDSAPADPAPEAADEWATLTAHLTIAPQVPTVDDLLASLREA